MPGRQKFVVQLGITEVQWNQDLPGFGTFCQSLEVYRQSQNA